MTLRRNLMYTWRWVVLENKVVNIGKANKQLDDII